MSKKQTYSIGIVAITIFNSIFFSFAFRAVADDFVPNDETENSSNTLILDADDTGGDITLQFGATLAEFLRYNSSTLSFDLSNKTLVLDAGNTGAGANVSIVANQGIDNDGTLRYNAITNQWEISNDGGAFNPIATGTGGVITTDLPVVQVRQAGGYTLSAATWADITFDTTDLENVSTVLEHNNTNTDNINIKANGIYMITYNLNLNEGTATHSFDSRVRLNDSTVMNGSVNSNSNYQNEYVATTVTFYANLTAGDFITLQAQRISANNLTDVAHPVMTIAKLEGIKGADGVDGTDGADGAPGPAGSGSTINLQEEGSAILNTPHSVLNFIGSSVTATDGGSGVANINITGDFSGSSLFRVQEGASNPATCVEGQVFYNTTNKFTYTCVATDIWKALQPRTGTFTDTTPGAIADNNTGEIFNDNPRPNIVTSSPFSTVLVSFMVRGRQIDNDTESSAFRVVRRIGGTNPVCGTDPQVGEVIIGYSTDNNAQWSTSGTFLDSPGVAGEIRYTVCNSTITYTSGDQDAIAEVVNVTLVELGN